MRTFLDITAFLGHFHPLLVHLPIGFLVLALLLEWMGSRDGQAGIRAAVPLVLLVGSISAALACITGWILSTSGGYDEQALSLHKWTALTIPFLSFFAWMVSTKRIKAPVFRSSRSLLFTLFGLTLVLSVAGHIGATLTHGAGYLSMNTLFDTQKKKPLVTDINQALAFEDLVQPMLDRKCGSCHNSAKKKGSLSMEDLSTLLKGGKHGPVIVWGQPLASEMIKRVSLDPGDKKFMPSDGKPPLSAEETALLKWWIEKTTGNADKKWTEFAASTHAPAGMTTYAEAWFRTLSSAHPSSNVPSDPTRDSVPKVPPVSQEALQKLKQAGFVIKLIDRDPVLLDVTLPAQRVTGPAKTGNSPRLDGLLAVRDNIIWLNLSGNNVSDEQMDVVNQCKNIRILKLGKTPVTDKGVARLRGMEQVQSINLYNTRITKSCLPDLSKMKKLKTVYVWGTSIKRDDLSSIDSSRLSVVAGNDPRF